VNINVAKSIGRRRQRCCIAQSRARAISSDSGARSREKKSWWQNMKGKIISKENGDIARDAS